VTGNGRERLMFHGAIVLFIGLLCGFPAIMEWGDPTVHAWRSTHLSLILAGIWLLATAGVAPSLVLARREASGLVWSLLGTAYGTMIGRLVETVTGVRGIEPKGPLFNWVAFAATCVVVLSSLTAALLTLIGARAALKRARAS